jgi:Zn-finger nucleic acid-binding protein
MQQQLQCPKCSGRMEQIQIEATQVDRCTTCRGLWFDALEDQDIRGTDGAETLDTAAVESKGTKRDARAIDCPRCQTRMIRMVDRLGKRIQYESCPRCHGKFLDAGEFRATEPRTMKDAVRKFLKGKQRKG